LFFFHSGQITAIENLKKHLILALLIFNIAFWLCIPSKKKAATTYDICHYGICLGIQCLAAWP
jgi:hypothetical protein